MRPDPFFGYSFLLRTILYVIVPAFGVFQFLRLRRALHVFQLEGYKRGRFLAWCRANPRRALFLSSSPAKKPLVMTSRAKRLLGTSTAVSLLGVVVPPAAAHLAAGAPYDLAVWGAATAATFLGTPLVLTGSDVLLTPLQSAINARYLRRARGHLDDLSPVVVAITGSFGKTSTKFAVERLIGPPGTALATPGSFNTPLGVCRTVNERLGPGHRFFIVEMGAYGEGEIAELMAFVRPKIGVLTAVGPAHVERFGSLDAIRRAKYEVVRDLPPDGTAVMNVDDPEVRVLADATEHVRVVRYGVDPDVRPEVTAADVRTTPKGTTMTIVVPDEDPLPVTTRLLGIHAVGHVLAAVAVARCAGRRLAELRGAIESLEPVEHRLQIIDGTGGVTVIDDAYNSNPAGADAALEVLGDMPARRKLVVTAGIVELGAMQAEANEAFGERAARVADTLIVVARLNREAIVAGARRASDGTSVITVDSLSEATAELRRLLEPGDVVLFENDLPDQYEA